MSDFVICLVLFFVGGWVGLGFCFGCWIWGTWVEMLLSLRARFKKTE